ncbi:hypothetical protein [Stenotrophomonas phage RAS14]
MDVQKFRKIHAKYEQGDRLTDAELKTLLAFYDDLVKVLDTAYLPMFTLTQREAWQNQRRLRYMQEARQGK